MITPEWLATNPNQRAEGLVKRVTTTKIPPANATLLILTKGHSSQLIFDRTATTAEQALQRSAAKWHRYHGSTIEDYKLVGQYSVKTGVNAPYSEVLHYAHMSETDVTKHFDASWFVEQKK